MEEKSLTASLDRLHTTPLGILRLRRNLGLPDAADPVAWCREQIAAPDTAVTRRGKNWYAETEGAVITVNAYSLTVITAHRRK